VADVRPAKALLFWLCIMPWAIASARDTTPSSGDSMPIAAAVVRLVERQSLRLCAEVENPSSPTKLDLPGDKGELQIPAAVVLAILKSQHGIEPIGTAGTRVTQQPKHGRLQSPEVVGDDPSYPKARYQLFRYVPKPAFYGRDSIKYEVLVNGTSFRVSTRLNVLATWNNGDSCRKAGEDRG
jgi:hypothetical protein